MIRSDDQIWNVAQREREEEANLRNRIETVEAAIAVGNRAKVLRQQPGFEDFVKELERLKSKVSSQLMTAPVTDAGLRELRGRAQSLNDMLAILTKTDSALEQLASQRKNLQNELDEALKRRPKPRQEVST